jgi:hypothetical protein
MRLSPVTVGNRFLASPVSLASRLSRAGPGSGRLRAAAAGEAPGNRRPGRALFKRDLPDAGIRFVDTGRFALETHAEEIAAAIDEFLVNTG